MVVHPETRGVGVGRRLVEQALAEPGEVTAWSHGNHPAAARLAAAYGLERVRDLWVMRRPVGEGAEALPALRVPDGVTLRGFDPEREDDADAVLRVNADAFAHHPEQGGMDADDLAARMAEDWFDPAGLILAHAGPTALLGVPLDQAALPRPRRGLRRRHRPRRPGSWAGQGADAGRAAPPRGWWRRRCRCWRGRWGQRDPALRRVRQRPRRRGVRRPRVRPRRRRHPRDVPPLRRSRARRRRDPPRLRSIRRHRHPCSGSACRSPRRRRCGRHRPRRSGHRRRRGP